jgi:hypothetical protein
MKIGTRYSVQIGNTQMYYSDMIYAKIAQLLYNQAYAKYIGLVLADNSVLFFESTLQSFNNNIVDGKLYMSKSVLLDMDEEMEIVALGVCPEPDIDTMFGRVELQEKIVKLRPDSVIVQCTINISVQGDVQLCGGDNRLVKVLLGLDPLGKDWYIALGDSTDNQALYRSIQDDLVLADMSVQDDGIVWQATLPNQSVYELLLCHNNCPVLRRVVSNLATYVPSTVYDGVIPIYNEPNTNIVIQINNALLSFWDVVRYGRKIRTIHTNLQDIVLASESKLIGMGNEYLVVSNKLEILLLVKLYDGRIDTLLNIPNNNCIVDMCGDGVLFVYSEGVFAIYHREQDDWMIDKIPLVGVENFAVASLSSTQWSIVCVVGGHSIVYYYDKVDHTLTQQEAFLGCSRVFRYDSLTIYIDDYVGNLSYALRGLSNNQGLANMISQAVSGKNIESGYYGMYLYSGGSCNTIHSPQLQSLGNHNVWLCGCYVVRQDPVDNMLTVSIYIRQHDVLEDIFELDIGVQVSSVGKLEDYIVLIDANGKLTTLQHDNKYGWIVKHDLKSTDRITGGVLYQRTSGLQSNSDINVKFGIGIMGV